MSKNFELLQRVDRDLARQSTQSLLMQPMENDIRASVEFTENESQPYPCLSCGFLLRDVLFCPHCDSFQGTVATPEYGNSESMGPKQAAGRMNTAWGFLRSWSRKRKQLAAWALLLLAMHLWEAHMPKGMFLKSITRALYELRSHYWPSSRPDWVQGTRR
jgi:hypothetical protein